MVEEVPACGSYSRQGNGMCMDVLQSMIDGNGSKESKL